MPSAGTLRRTACWWTSSLSQPHLPPQQRVTVGSSFPCQTLNSKALLIDSLHRAFLLYFSTSDSHWSGVLVGCSFHLSSSFSALKSSTPPENLVLQRKDSSKMYNFKDLIGSHKEEEAENLHITPQTAEKKLISVGMFSMKYPLIGENTPLIFISLLSARGMPWNVRQAADMLCGRRRGSLDVSLTCQGCRLWQWLPVEMPPDSLPRHKTERLWKVWRRSGKSFLFSLHLSLVWLQFGRGGSHCDSKYPLWCFVIAWLWAQSCIRGKICVCACV